LQNKIIVPEELDDNLIMSCSACIISVSVLKRKLDVLHPH